MYYRIDFDGLSRRVRWRGIAVVLELALPLVAGMKRKKEDEDVEEERRGGLRSTPPGRLESAGWCASPAWKKLLIGDGSDGAVQLGDLDSEFFIVAACFVLKNADGKRFSE